MGCLTELFCERGVPVHLRSDNGPEFIARFLRQWLERLAVKPLYIEPGRPWVATFDIDLRGAKQDLVVLLVAVVRAGGAVALAPAALRDLALDNPNVAVRSMRIST